MQLGQADGAVRVFDVAEDTAGADRGELLIISDQLDTRTATDGELNQADLCPPVDSSRVAIKPAVALKASHYES
jgi:hypothetical protein